MATCSAVGQGVGTAAALCAQADIDPADLVADPRKLRDLQQTLLRNDCFLIGARNEDPGDLARSARITASSSAPEFPPDQVISGVTRCVHGEGGVVHERAIPGMHRWISGTGLPASLSLEWTDAVRISSIQLIFDTGLHRLLTFSLAKGVHSRMHWGLGAPETVRDYSIAVRSSASWHPLFAVTGNYQRLRRHTLPTPIEADALRITVTATHGDAAARIMEVRVNGFL